MAVVSNLNPSHVMTEVVFLGLGVLIGAFLGWWVGGKNGGRRIQEQLAAFAQGLQGGNLPDPSRTSPDEAPEIREIRGLLSREWSHRGPDHEDMTRRALGRIALFLRHRVESPLLAGLEGGGKELRDGADEALAGVEDLEFFLEELPGPSEPEMRNLAELVQEVTREFSRQSTVLVKVQSPERPVGVRIEPEPVKDAIFLVLHNAGEFGSGQPVEVTLGAEAGKARLWVRDRGPGFTEEALLRAMDPFYSTSPDGLGLGLPHARQAINSQGGEVFLRNGKGGGAEVEIQFPLAGS
ncbi:MAG: HAMP domain-containing histidine kinase [Gemmatimonadales bacterium]|nr:MAG: HAMP domain-containing histidine kinase [Gemmatimonadales bacterium]